MVEWTTTGTRGSYRELKDIDDKKENIDMSFIVLPDSMSQAQKEKGIFCKFNLVMPYAKPIQMTVGVEQTTDERYQGFKFKHISNSDGKDNIPNTIPFEVMGRIFQTLHNSIVKVDGTVVNQVALDKAIEIAAIGEPSRVAFQEGRKAQRKTLAELRKAAAAATVAATVTGATPAQTVTENVAAEAMAGAVE